MANPDCLIIFGGTHVSNQAERLFKDYPAVDVLVHDEGELTFRDIVKAVCAGKPVAGIAGTAVNLGGKIVHGLDRPRIDELDSIPSPILSGIFELTDPRTGRFAYDAGLLETNRGCPYKCSFCYWGGAVGQRVRRYSADRLRREVEVMAAAKVETLVLCDANFGMRAEDLDFARMVVETRAKYGYPYRLETSWAKNKGAVFYEIVELLHEAGLKSSFTLALQSLDDGVLQSMRRRNMKINDWKHLAHWLRDRDLDCYAELIWGSPDETVESFLAGYDALAQEVPRIAIYPLILIPNTAYHEGQLEAGLITVRGETDDFQYVLASRSVSLAESMDMFRFIFWARLLAENMVLRATWRTIPRLLRMTQSEFILHIRDAVENTDDDTARWLSEQCRRSAADPDALAEPLAYAFTSSRFDALVLAAVRPLLDRLPADQAALALEALQHDLDSRPFPGPSGGRHADAEIVLRDGREYWSVVREYGFSPADEQAVAAGGSPFVRVPRTVELRFPAGFELYCSSTNHEITAAYVGEEHPVVDLDGGVPRHGESAAGPVAVGHRKRPVG
jgi:radical SAM C-methyltransferase